MCGIAGIYSAHPMDGLVPSVRRIIRSQHRRGPDFNAVTDIPGHRAGVVLGHNRLSIIDLSPLGNQPMWDGDRRLCIVYNGEIYNYVELRAELVSMGHRFISSSDTEVILESFKQWGMDAFKRLNGMFAIALYDTLDERLYLVRDRFGVKPLYYVPRGDTVHFASTAGEIARILSLSPNLEYLACGIRYGLYENAEAAPFIGMKTLLPGCVMQIAPGDGGGMTYSLRPYYDLKARTDVLTNDLATMPLERAVETLADLLDDAVRIRLRSDVPVAVSLSGGLDSSTVASLAASHPQKRLRGFTYGHPQMSSSEGPMAALLAKMARIDVTYVWPGISDICLAYQESLRAQAGPFTGGSIIAQYLVFKAARAAGFKVLLGGQGGDEAFMGYRKFQAFRMRELAANGQYFEALNFGLSLLPTIFAERWRWLNSWKARSRYLRRSGMTTILNLPASEMDIGYSTSASLRERQMLDITFASLPTLLRYEDSSSMGNGIESRLPLLDYRVMEFGIALPEALNLRRGHGKWLVRRAMAGRIPEEIRLARYKRGFDVQQSLWVDGGLGTCIRTMLHERLDQVRDYLPSGSVPDDLFSNEQLKRRPSRFAEATTLLWLANRTDRSFTDDENPDD